MSTPERIPKLRLTFPGRYEYDLFVRSWAYNAPNTADTTVGKDKLTIRGGNLFRLTYQIELTDYNTEEEREWLSDMAVKVYGARAELLN